MGSSAKRKKEKAKDFQKPKLKVGKAKPKASNHTDTSFKAKSIVVTKQSLSISAPTATAQFTHHVSMLRSKSDTQRRDSLAHLTTAASERTTLPEPVATLLPKLQPLIVDASPAVRTQLLKLLRSLPPREIRATRVDQLLLYARAAMTHLAADIRTFALDVLAWLLSVAGAEVVACPGGWMKTLRCFMGLLGWEAAAAASSSTTATVKHTSGGGWSNVKGGLGKVDRGQAQDKVVARQVAALAVFVEVGLGAGNEGSGKRETIVTSTFPYLQIQQHLLPQRSAAFAHLTLFGPPPDEESARCEDREERQRLFVEHFKDSIDRGLAQVKKEGGELGRAASGLERTVQRGLAGYDL